MTNSAAFEQLAAIASPNVSALAIKAVAEQRMNRYSVHKDAKGVHRVWDRITNKTRLPIASDASKGAPSAALANFADAFAEVMQLNASGIVAKY